MGPFKYTIYLYDLCTYFIFKHDVSYEIMHAQVSCMVAEFRYHGDMASVII